MCEKNAVRKNGNLSCYGRFFPGGVHEGRGAVADFVIGEDAEIKHGALADAAFDGDGATHAFAETFGDDEAETMEGLERAVLAKLGVPDPYLVGEGEHERP